MSQSWLQQLELELEEKLNNFLEANPSQQSLLSQQTQKDHWLYLHKKYQSLQKKAEHKRTALLEQAKNIHKWQQRASRARKSKDLSLAMRADDHVKKLMDRGRQFWSDFKSIERQLKTLEGEFLNLSKDSKKVSESIEEDWKKFEVEVEFDQLRKRSGVNK